MVKIHPGSTLADKKMPAIIFDELVSVLHRVRQWLAGVDAPQGIYEPYLCTRCFICSEELLRWHDAHAA